MVERADPRDRLVVRDGIDASMIIDLPQGARLGTSSPRRAAQVRRLRPDLVTTLLRGNVQTRLSKLASGEVDATLLAAAGLDRLEMHAIGSAQSIDSLLNEKRSFAPGAEFAKAARVKSMADYEASADLIGRLKKGQQLSVQAINSNGQPISLSLPLSDFAKAYDGPPTDPKVFEEQQKKLQDELQRRANDARQKLQQQPQSQAPTGAKPQ